MKKYLIILAVAALLFSGCSSSKASSADVSVQTLHANDVLVAESRTELAEKLGCTLEELDDVIIYAWNQNKILPDTAQKAGQQEFERGITEEGLPWITKEELKTMITPVVITKENWSEWFGPRMREVEYISYDENDNEISETAMEPEVVVKEGYYYDWSDLSLCFIDNVTGEKFEYESGWPRPIEEEGGKFYVVTYGEDWSESRREFSASDYTCIKANGIVYKNDLDESLLCIQDENYNNMLLSDYDGDYEENDLFICVKTDLDENAWMVWLGGLGALAYDR